MTPAAPESPRPSVSVEPDPAAAAALRRHAEAIEIGREAKDAEMRAEMRARRSRCRA